MSGRGDVEIDLASDDVYAKQHRGDPSRHAHSIVPGSDIALMVLRGHLHIGRLS